MDGWMGSANACEKAGFFVVVYLSGHHHMNFLLTSRTAESIDGTDSA